MEPPLHISHKLLTYPIQRTSPIFSYNHAANHAGSDKQVTALVSDKHFGLVDINQLGLEKNITVCRVRKASSDIAPTTHDTFRGLNILRSIYGPDDYVVNTTQIKSCNSQILHCNI